MKLIQTLFVASALAAATYAGAADWGSALRRGDLGTPAPATSAQKTVKINASTQYIDADHFSTLKIENDKGQSFIWTFDTFGEVGFPLKVIVPKDFAAGATRVYVRHPAAHYMSGN